MKNENEYYDARQHLNLSQHAYDVIESDQFDFMAKPSFSGMLNKVLSAYCEDAEAAIDGAAERYREALEEKLTGVADCETKREIIDALTREHRAHCAARANSYDRACQFKFQLNRENYAFIKNWQDGNDDYHGSAGRFIKAVIEEYAAKPFYEREEIILRSEICSLNSFIEAGTLITLTTRTANGRLRFTVRPYKICTDRYRTFHYLTGFSRPAASHEEERPASFRLSRIEKITPAVSRSGRITAAQKKLLDERLGSVGVQFLLQEQELIRVRLSPKGKQLFDTQTNLRPVCTGRLRLEDGSWEYQFQCAPIQAQFYFFKFGAEAVILSPPALRREFGESYRKAAALYVNEGEIK